MTFKEMQQHVNPVPLFVENVRSDSLDNLYTRLCIIIHINYSSESIKASL